MSESERAKQTEVDGKCVCERGWKEGEVNH